MAMQQSTLDPDYTLMLAQRLMNANLRAARFGDVDFQQVVRDLQREDIFFDLRKVDWDRWPSVVKHLLDTANHTMLNQN
jgi:hypothetical protein